MDELVGIRARRRIPHLNDDAFLPSLADFVWESKNRVKSSSWRREKMTHCVNYSFRSVCYFLSVFYLQVANDREMLFSYTVNDGFALMCSAHEGFNRLRLTGVKCRDRNHNETSTKGLFIQNLKFRD